MKISGFTFVKNATKFYYPIKQSIASVLPIVDEFIVAMGESDEDDKTEAEILSLRSDKIKIMRRQWDETLFKNAMIYSNETNFALSQCSGDWCFYIQADEVLHEAGLSVIKKAFEKYLNDTRVDGSLLKYRHFWGDYAHLLDFHGWYAKEIRILRNHIGAISYGDAQSFRRKDGKKLNVIDLYAFIHHYGWVRPPELMRSAKREKETQYMGREVAKTRYEVEPETYSYGALGRIPLYKGTHPAVMKDWMAKHHWGKKLDYGKKFIHPGRDLKKHEKPKYRLLSVIESAFLGGRRLFGYKNWKTLQKEGD